MPTNKKPKAISETEAVTRTPLETAQFCQASPLSKDRLDDNGDGVLTQAECEALRQAYLRGAKGSVLIGLSGARRVVTTLLPRADAQEAAIRQMTRAAMKLKAMNCDGYVYATQVSFPVPDSYPKLALIVRERQATHRLGKIVWLDAPQQPYAFEDGVSEAVTQLLDLILQPCPNPNEARHH